jgi:hypothetical protein
LRLIFYVISGILMTNSKGKKFFVTARLIQYQLAEHFFNIEAVGSYTNCILCRNVRGKRENLLAKTIYVGHRCLLSELNYLRFFGQSKACCPKDFHSVVEKSVTVKGEKSQSEKLSHASLKVVIDEQQSNNTEYAYPTMVSANQFIANGGACEGNATYKGKIHAFVNQEGSKFEGFFEYANSKYINDYRIFDNYLYYATCDFRPQRTVRRESREVYDNKVLSAVSSNKTVDGIKGKCAFDLLPYFDISTQFEWDWFHALGNVMKSTLKIWKGEVILRGGQEGIVQLSKSIHSHPFLWHKKYARHEELRWQFTKVIF